VRAAREKAVRRWPARPGARYARAVTFASRVAHLVEPVAGPLLDLAVPISFGRPGLALRRLVQDDAELAVDMAGRTCVVTGGNSGIGLATARALARRGATVILGCRNAERGNAAVAQVRAESGNRDVHFGLIDLSRLASVQHFAERLRGDQVDVLVHSAAVLPAEHEETEDGVELTFATNVLGPFLLTALLLPRLHRGVEARVIHVSSGGMYLAPLDLEGWHVFPERFDGVRAYAATKRAVVVLNELWAERFAGTPIAFHAMHPGWADTPAVQSSLPRFRAATRSILRSPDEGADTVLWLAVAERLRGATGGFYFDRAPRRTHLLPWSRESDEDRARLWQLCCQLAAVDDGALSPAELARHA
jgi:dehydrogenase/reductase SDR family member 12